MYDPSRFVQEPNGSMKLSPEELDQEMKRLDLGPHLHEAQGAYVFSTESPAKTLALAKTIVNYTLDSTISVASTAASLPSQLVSSVGAAHAAPMPAHQTLPPIQRSPGSGDAYEAPHTPLTPM